VCVVPCAIRLLSIDPPEMQRNDPALGPGKRWLGEARGARRLERKLHRARDEIEGLRDLEDMRYVDRAAFIWQRSKSKETNQIYLASTI
jgi:hypothetical protein